MRSEDIPPKSVSQDSKNPPEKTHQGRDKNHIPVNLTYKDFCDFGITSYDTIGVGTVKMRENF